MSDVFRFETSFINNTLIGASANAACALYRQSSGAENSNDDDAENSIYRTEFFDKPRLTKRNYSRTSLAKS
jgi:hypothetical protein